PLFNVVNWGINDFGMGDAVSSEPNRAAKSCKTNAGVPSAAVVFLGTNDFHHGNQSASDVFNEMAAEIQILKQAGCTVFAGTMISRTGNDNNNGSYDADKNAYDALILTRAKGAGADAIIDFAADPRLG